MPVMPPVVFNPYPPRSFKHHFIVEFNKLAKAKKDQDTSIGIIMAEGLGIMLDLINTDMEKDDKATEIITGELHDKAIQAPLK